MREHTMANLAKLADAASIVAVSLCAVWLLAALLTDPNIWFADLAHGLILPFVLISVALRHAASRANN